MMNISGPAAESLIYIRPNEQRSSITGQRNPSGSSSFSQDDEIVGRKSVQERRYEKAVSDFVAKKYNILFKKIDYGTQTSEEFSEDCYAVPPPIEIFLTVPENERRKHFFESIQVQNIVIGIITGVHDTGLYSTLLCMQSGRIKDIRGLAIKAFCPIDHMPSAAAHKDVFESFHPKDLIRAAVSSISGERIILTMQNVFNSKVSLGLINEDDLPMRYKRMADVKGQSYEEMLSSILQFHNPSSVAHLFTVTGLSKLQPHISLHDDLAEKRYRPDEYASSLRRTQCNFWAMKSVHQGINYFKEGKSFEAFQFLNKALDLDEENVEALVARGALFANNGNFSRALADFEKSFNLNPSHANGTKYYAETLVAVGKRYQDKGDLESAMGSFRRALHVKQNFGDAQRALESLALSMSEKKEQLKKKSRLKSKKPVAVIKPTSPNDKAHSAVQKLKYLLDEEKSVGKQNKSRKGTSRTSSSDDSSSSESQSKHRSKSKWLERRRTSSSSSSSDNSSRSSRTSSSSSSSESSHGHSQIFSKIKGVERGLDKDKSSTKASEKSDKYSRKRSKSRSQSSSSERARKHSNRRMSLTSSSKGSHRLPEKRRRHRSSSSELNHRHSRRSQRRRHRSSSCSEGKQRISKKSRWHQHSSSASDDRQKDNLTRSRRESESGPTAEDDRSKKTTVKNRDKIASEYSSSGHSKRKYSVSKSPNKSSKCQTLSSNKSSKNKGKTHDSENIGKEPDGNPGKRSHSHSKAHITTSDSSDDESNRSYTAKKAPQGFYFQTQTAVDDIFHNSFSLNKFSGKTNVISTPSLPTTSKSADSAHLKLVSEMEQFLEKLKATRAKKG